MRVELQTRGWANSKVSIATLERLETQTIGTLSKEPGELSFCPALAYSLDLAEAWHALHNLSRSDRSNEGDEVAADSNAIFCNALSRISRAMVSFDLEYSHLDKKEGRCEALHQPWEVSLDCFVELTGEI